MVRSIALDPEALAHTERVASHLRLAISRLGGWMPFDQRMEIALYAPGLGYYAAGNVKLAGGQSSSSHTLAGDFVTAPELTPLFARTLATQIALVLSACESRDVLEFGAGSGALAADTLDALDAAGLSAQYRIIELSPDLRAVQQARLARFGDRVQWLDQLPDTFVGCVVANEVLDAMPVTAFEFDAKGVLCERGVALDESGAFVWVSRPASEAMQLAMQDRLPILPGYRSEVNLRGEAWMREMGTWLKCGAALLFDYGFPQSEFYHPQRAEGTLMAHMRHHAHGDVLAAPGIQDITAHVDFTAMAQAALDGGLDLLGYSAQGRFLMNAGLPALISTDSDIRERATMASAVNKLVSEAEMGELFKVLGVGRDVSVALPGFGARNRRHML